MKVLCASLPVGHFVVRAGPMMAGDACNVIPQTATLAGIASIAARIEIGAGSSGSTAGSFMAGSSRSGDPF